jgi:hypothetical protein
MIILLDKNIDPNISSILFTNDGAEYDQFFWNLNENTTVLVDNINFKISVVASNMSVSFSNADAMNLYLDQFKMVSKARNIFSEGSIELDPYYDKPKTGEIVSHTYTNTDIEKDLIEGIK